MKPRELKPKAGNMVVEVWHSCHPGSWEIAKLLTQGRAILNQFCITPVGPQQPEHSKGKRAKKTPTLRLAKLNPIVFNPDNLNLWYSAGLSIREVCKAWVYSPVFISTRISRLSSYSTLRQLPRKEIVHIQPSLSGVNYVQSTEQTL